MAIAHLAPELQIVLSAPTPLHLLNFSCLTLYLCGFLKVVRVGSGLQWAGVDSTQGLREKLQLAQPGSLPYKWGQEEQEVSHSSSPSPTEADEVEGLFPTVERSVLIRRRGKECWVDGNNRSPMVGTQADFC